MDTLPLLSLKDQVLLIATADHNMHMRWLPLSHIRYLHQAQREAEKRERERERERERDSSQSVGSQGEDCC